MGDIVRLEGLGWMKFTINAGNVLHLGGASQSTPGDQLSVSDFLATGIPQNDAKTAFRDGLGDICADIYLKSGTWSVADDGSTPTAVKGNTDTASPIGYRMAPALHKFKAISITNMVVEVIVYRGVRQ
jgi:hypothetical protein